MPDNFTNKKILKRRAIQKIELLPSIPVVLQKIIATSSDPNTSAQDLQKIILKDQSITGAILKLANSAYYGYTRGIDDIGSAVVVIGFNTAVSVAISVSVFKTLSQKINDDEFNRKEFWKHTISAGEAARILAKEINYEFAGRAHIIGLLHDIGKVVLSFLFTTDFGDAVFEARTVNKELFVCEKQVFGFDHQDAGSWLGERWKLPESILAGIKYHHAIDDCPEQMQTEALIGHVANYIAKSAHFGNSGDEQLPHLHPLVESKLNITQEMLSKVENTLEKKREEIDTFLESIQ